MQRASCGNRYASRPTLWIATLRRRAQVAFSLTCFAMSCGASLSAQIVVAGSENKLKVNSSEWLPKFDAQPDAISVIDFSEFPPRVEHVSGISNTVIGPPSNIAITPDGRVALISSSLKLDRTTTKGYSTDTQIHVVDLTSRPPRRVGHVLVGRQPSGLSITPDGRRALVANRADGTVTVLALAGTTVEPVQTLEVGTPEDQVSDVAIAPDGKLALVSVREGFHLRVLKIDADVVSVTERKLSVCGKPYRTAITPDGELGLTNGSGQGGADLDALTVIDLTANPIRTVDYIALGVGIESFGVSPDGGLVAAMLIQDSNRPEGDPLRTENGMLVLLARRAKTYSVVQRVPIGRYTQGAAFTSDGKYLLTECYTAREIWVFRVSGEAVEDTGHRIKTPGFPASLRAAP